MNTKAAISLSINVLVIIIISLVILGAGIAFLYNLFHWGTSFKAELDEQTKQQLEQLLVDQGKRVALPLYSVDLYPGEDHVFGLGILNIGGEGLTDRFTLEIKAVKVIGEETITDPGYLTYMESWLLYNQEEMVIKENEHRSEPIHVSVPKDARKGQHIFNARVLNNGQQYDNLQKFYVNVKWLINSNIFKVNPNLVLKWVNNYLLMMQKY